MTSRSIRTVSLIGMPGAGKSTIGVLAAKRLGLRFCDTDLELQAAQGLALQELLETHGLEGFKRIEEETLLSLPLAGQLVATGGSVVYAERAMRRLRAAGPVIYLRVCLDELASRLTRMEERGVAMPSGMTLAELYAERIPLYEAWADLTLPAEGAPVEAVSARLAEMIRTFETPPRA